MTQRDNPDATIAGVNGRLEVQYLTATDEATGTGLWVHHETVAPTTEDDQRGRCAVRV